MVQNPRIILIGSVNSSRKTLEKLIVHGLNVVAVLGLDPEFSKSVSGFVDLKILSDANNIPFQYFNKVNDIAVSDFVASKKPDLLFVVGLSQMIKEPLLSIATAGNIGFHPTRLPEGRGRGAVAWIILGKVKGAATFFKMDEGMDSGPIWAQQDYDVGDEDNASTVVNQILSAIDTALDNVLPKLKQGDFETSEQDESKATYLGKRSPEDGHIDWNLPAQEIHKLIRAVSKPLPGAYTFLGNQKIIVWNATMSNIKNHLGVAGRIIISDSDNGIHVQTGDGLLKLETFEGVDTEKLKVGVTLGFNFEKEYFKLLDRIDKIELKLPNHEE
jgi:methionyl-tRNA formyltransferase